MTRDAIDRVMQQYEKATYNKMQLEQSAEEARHRIGELKKRIEELRSAIGRDDL